MERVCGNCEYYIRHFIYSSGSFSPIDHGHCTYPMLKNRTADHKSCKYFEKRKRDDKVNVVQIRIDFKTM